MPTNTFKNTFERNDLIVRIETVRQTPNLIEEKGFTLEQFDKQSDKLLRAYDTSEIIIQKWLKKDRAKGIPYLKPIMDSREKAKKELKQFLNQFILFIED